MSWNQESDRLKFSMRDDKELVCSNSKKRQQIIDDLEYLKSFLRQQDPVAFLKIQRKKSACGQVASQPSHQVVSNGEIPSNFLQSSEQAPERLHIQPSGDEDLPLATKALDLDRQLTASKLPALPTKGPESISSKFGDLIIWTQKNFPNDSLLRSLAARELKSEPTSHPIVLLVSEPGDKERANSEDFLAKVTGALVGRNIATRSLQWGQWQVLADLNLSALKLIIGPPGSDKRLIDDEIPFAQPPLFLSVNWVECAQSAEQKAQLWAQIKRYLDRKTR